MLKTTSNNNDNVTPTLSMCSVHLHWLTSLSLVR